MGKTNSFRTNNNKATSFSSGESYNLGVAIGSLQKDLENLRRDLESTQQELPNKIEHHIAKVLDAKDKDKKTIKNIILGNTVAIICCVATIIGAYFAYRSYDATLKSLESSGQPSTHQESTQ